MPPEPLVSIITAVHNGARTIGAMLASVDAQTESGWEHLIVDDGSSDETAAIVAAAADPRRYYERQPHGGVSVARNRALERARGTFLLFLDADDWLLPHALRAHLDHLAAYPSCGVSVSDGHFCTDDGRPITTFSARRGPVPTAGMLAGLLVDSGLVAPPLSAMVRASIVRTHGIRFAPALTLREDTLFWIEVAQRAQFQFLDVVTCGYRWHPGSTTLRTPAATRRAQHEQFAARVLAAPYFAELPEPIRERFLHAVLTEALADRVDAQARLIDSPPFAALSAAARARLLRLTASEHLLALDAVETARSWIRQARRLAPRDPVAQALAALLAIHPRLAQLAVRVRRSGQRRPDDSLWRYAAPASEGAGSPASRP